MSNTVEKIKSLNEQNEVVESENLSIVIKKLIRVDMWMEVRERNYKGLYRNF